MLEAAAAERGRPGGGCRRCMQKAAAAPFVFWDTIGKEAELL